MVPVSSSAGQHCLTLVTLLPLRAVLLIVLAPVSTRSDSDTFSSINQAGFILITAVQSAVVRSVRGGRGKEAEGRGRQEVKEEVGGGGGRWKREGEGKGVRCMKKQDGAQMR